MCIRDSTITQQLRPGPGPNQNDNLSLHAQLATSSNQQSSSHTNPKLLKF